MGFKTTSLIGEANADLEFKQGFMLLFFLYDISRGLKMRCLSLKLPNTAELYKVLIKISATDIPVNGLVRKTSEAFEWSTKKTPLRGKIQDMSCWELRLVDNSLKTVTGKKS